MAPLAGALLLCDKLPEESDAISGRSLFARVIVRSYRAAASHHDLIGGGRFRPARPATPIRRRVWSKGVTLGTKLGQAPLGRRAVPRRLSPGAPITLEVSPDRGRSR